MSDFKQPSSLAIDRLTTLVMTDESLEPPVKEAFVADILSATSSDLAALRGVLSDVNGATNGKANQD